MNGLVERLGWAGAGALIFVAFVLLVCRVGAIHPAVKVWLCRLAFLKPLMALLWAPSVVVSLPKAGSASDSGVLACYLALLWAVGTALVAAHAWRAWRGARLLVVASHKIPGVPGLRSLLEALGLGGLEVRVLAGLHEPCVVGLVRPRLIVPHEAWFDRGVLIHEAAHIRSRDIRWNLFGWFAYAAFWFVPGMGRLLREASLWQEVQADRIARIHGAVAPSQQAQTLLAMLERSSAPSWAVASLSGDAANVARRVAVMFRSRHSTWALIVVLPLILGLAVPLRPQQPIRSPLASRVAALDNWPSIAAPIASQ